MYSKGLIRLAKWAKGKTISILGKDSDQCKVKNVEGEEANYNLVIVTTYNNKSTQRDIDKMTRPLDQDGVDAIVLGSKDEDTVEVTRDNRKYLRIEGDGILRDEESIVLLEILSANIDGREDGWRFSDGDVEFNALLLDEEFLESVRSGETTFSAGVSIEACMRRVQSRPNMRLKTERSIVKVLKFIPAKYLTT